MSATTPPSDPEDRQEENLDKLYELREQFEIIADSDAEYATYAQNALDRLEEAGYDV